MTPPNIYIAIKKKYKKYSIKDNGPKTRIQEIAKLGLLCEYKISHFDFNPEGYDSEYITNLVQRIHNHLIAAKARDNAKLLLWNPYIVV